MDSKALPPRFNLSATVFPDAKVDFVEMAPSGAQRSSTTRSSRWDARFHQAAFYCCTGDFTEHSSSTRELTRGAAFSDCRVDFRRSVRSRAARIARRRLPRLAGLILPPELASLRYIDDTFRAHALR